MKSCNILEIKTRELFEFGQHGAEADISNSTRSLTLEHKMMIRGRLLRALGSDEHVL